MYIIYNADGSINKQYLNEFIQEGNSYANVLFVAIIGREPADYYLNAFAKLPNNVNIELPTEDSSLILDGITYVGKNVSITSDATTRPGSLQLNIVAENLPGTERLVSFNLYLIVNETGLAVDDPAVMTIAQYESLINKVNEIDKFEKVDLEGESGTLTDVQYYHISEAVGSYIKLNGEIYWQNKITDQEIILVCTTNAYKNVITINKETKEWSLIRYQWFRITVSSSHISGTLTTEQLASLTENLAVEIVRGEWVFVKSVENSTNYVFRSWGENELRTININKTTGAWSLGSMVYKTLIEPDDEFSTVSEGALQNKLITVRFNEDEVVINENKEGVAENKYEASKRVRYSEVEAEFDANSTLPVQNKVISRRVQTLEENIENNQEEIIDLKTLFYFYLYNDGQYLKVDYDTVAPNFSINENGELIYEGELTLVRQENNIIATELSQFDDNRFYFEKLGVGNLKIPNLSEISFYDLQDKTLLEYFNENNTTIYSTLRGDIASALAEAKSYTDTRVSSVYRVKGSVQNYEDLPANPEVGDVYNVINANPEHHITAGENVVWNGTQWDELGGIFDTTAITSRLNQLDNTVGNHETRITQNEEEIEKCLPDDSLSTTSENPVQNKVITVEINDLKTTTSENSSEISTNKIEISKKINYSEIEDTFNSHSSLPVQNKVISRRVQTIEEDIELNQEEINSIKALMFFYVYNDNQYLKVDYLTNQPNFSINSNGELIYEGDLSLSRSANNIILTY